MRLYLGEFRIHWRALLSASLGLAAGTISNYVNNLFTPSLMGEFGWSKSEFALIGLTVMIAAVCLPIAGRLVDRLGTRRMALLGVVGLPLVFVGLSLMNGDFLVYFGLSTLQMLFVSCIAGILVYTRLITGTFTLARGVALGLASCAPPLATAFFSPVLSELIANSGWRAGYLVMAGFTAAFGLAALLLMPKTNDAAPVRAVASRDRTRFGEILRSRLFQLLFLALILCNLHFTVLTTQLKVVVLERGVSAETGSLMISLFALGVVGGRMICGVALDRFSTHLVAAASFVVPSLGLALLASGVTEPWLVGAGIVSLGLAMGAEGDLVVYLAAKYFPVGVFSSVLGLFTAAMAISATVGALVLSAMLDRTGSYGLFLSFTSVTMMIGAILFLQAPRFAGGRDESGHASAPVPERGS
ncbi:Major Facilitator Superfamily protein [compost metagenome]